MDVLEGPVAEPVAGPVLIRIGEVDDRQVDLRLLGDLHDARGDGGLTVGQRPVLVLPEVLHPVRVRDQLGEPTEQLPVEVGVGILRQRGDRRPLRVGERVHDHRQAGGLAEPVGAEVPGRGEILEQGPVGQGVIRRAEGVDRDQAVLVEVVVGDQIGVAVEVGAPVQVAEGHLGGQVGLGPRRCGDAGPVGQAQDGAGVGRTVDDDVGAIDGGLVGLVAEWGRGHRPDGTTSIPLEVKGRTQSKRARSSWRRIFWVPVFGRSSTITTRRGAL